MKYLFAFAIVVFAMSCSKNDSDSLDEKPIGKLKVEENVNFFLDFEINDSLYYENQDTFVVQSEQVIEEDIEFILASKLSNTYPYFYWVEESPDSVLVIGSIKYQALDNVTFEKKEYNLDILLKEDISNLTQVSDTSYTYTSNEVLAQRLTNEDFGTANLFGSGNMSTIFLTFPEIDEDMQNYFGGVSCSNGFYFPHEKFEMTKVAYDEVSDMIRIEGQFNVEIKFLSCGFFSTHAVNNANFRALIR